MGKADIGKKQITPTGKSLQLRKLAQELVQNCPSKLGGEIIVVGSVGMGIADAASDLDLELWVHELPQPGVVTLWLESLGVAHIIGEPQTRPTEVALIFQYQGVWVEMNWHKISDKEALVAEILAGESTDRLKNVQVFDILNCVILRTTGVIGALRQNSAFIQKQCKEGSSNPRLRFGKRHTVSKCCGAW